jgi:hypothetical protein
MNFTMTAQLMKPLFANLLNEGGPLFMYTLLITLIICIGLIVKALLKGDENGKTQKLIASVSLFALVWGFLGQIIGLITAFDFIQSFGNVKPEIIAGGIKVASLAPAFGMVVFLIARLGIIALILKKK